MPEPAEGARSAPVAAARSAVADGMRQLAEWASSIEAGAVPTRSRRHAVLVIGDMLAAILAVRDEPEMRRAHEALLASPGRCEATVFRGGRDRTGRVAAAVANGLAGNGAQLDPGYRKVPCHAGLYIVPALLAEAESVGMTVAEVLHVMAVAFEVTTRIPRAFPAPPSRLYPAAIYGAVGTAATVALARHLSGAALCDALATASTLVAPGPFALAVRGDFACDTWAGTGAWNGFQAVEWSGFGFTASADTPFDVYAVALGCGCEPDQLTGRLGKEWAIDLSFHKVFAACQYTHSAIEATLALRGDLPARAAIRDDAITRVLVETGPLGMTLDNAVPRSRLATKYSMQHAVAATLVTGDGGVGAFDGNSVENPVIKRLRERVTLAPMESRLPPPNDRPSRVTVTLADGSAVTRTCLSARGGPDRPLDEDEIMSKIATISAPVYPRLADGLKGLLELPAATLARPWPELLEALLAA